MRLPLKPPHRLSGSLRHGGRSRLADLRLVQKDDAALRRSARDVLARTTDGRITLLPGGGTFFTESTQTKEPGFGNYGLGGSLAVHVNRFVAVEGEVIGGIGVTQDVQSGAGVQHVKSPGLADYSGNLVLSAANGG